MPKEIFNQTLLPDNQCFGCGHSNHQGLKIEICRDEQNPNQLKATFNPADYLIGFPGITHGGAIYTALDCLAAWVPTALRRETKAIWILRHATMTYHRPALQGQELLLTGFIQEEGKPGESIVVQTQAHNAKGDLLAEGTFKVIPLPVEKFKKVSGLEKIPENLKYILG